MNKDSIIKELETIQLKLLYLDLLRLGVQPGRPSESDAQWNRDEYEALEIADDFDKLIASLKTE